MRKDGCYMSMDLKLQGMPLKSPGTILDSVYKGEKLESFPELERVLSHDKKFEPDKYVRSLSQPDEATEALYKNGRDGKVQFPYAADHRKGDGIWLYEGKIGEMTSQRHKESLMQNAQSTVANLSERKYPDFNKQDVALMGLLSNAGKKYTARTGSLPQLKDGATGKILDPRGQLSFPMADRVSAYIAARQLKKTGLSKEEARPLVTAIFARSEPARWAHEAARRDIDGNVLNHSPSKEAFIKRYGQQTADLTSSLAKASHGYPDRMSLIAGKPVFEKGNRVISEDLVEYVKEHPDRAARAEKKPAAKNNINEFRKGVTQVSPKAAIQEKIDPNQANIKSQEDAARRAQEEENRKEYERDQAALEQMEKEEDAARRRIFNAAIKTGIIVDVALSASDRFSEIARDSDGNAGRRMAEAPDRSVSQRGSLTSPVKSETEEKAIISEKNRLSGDTPNSVAGKEKTKKEHKKEKGMDMPGR